MRTTGWDGERRATGIAVALFLAAVLLAVLGMLALAPTSSDLSGTTTTSPTPLAGPANCPLPTAPTGVRATPEKGFVAVTWSDARQEPTTYRVYRRPDPAAGWVLITEVTLDAGAPRRALDASATGATEPEYAVRVVGLCGESPLDG